MTPQLMFLTITKALGLSFVVSVLIISPWHVAVVVDYLDENGPGSPSLADVLLELMNPLIQLVIGFYLLRGGNWVAKFAKLPLAEAHGHGFDRAMESRHWLLVAVKVLGLFLFVRALSSLVGDLITAAQQSQQAQTLGVFGNMAGSPLPWTFVVPEIVQALLGIFLFFGAKWIVAVSGLPHLRSEGLCATCGYDVRGLSGKCPECGMPIKGAQKSNESEDE